MNNPLNELSAVYQNSIVEGEKKGPCKRTGDPVCNCTPEGDSPDGGDTAKPGKNKNYVKPMGENRYVSWRDELREVAYGVSSVDRDEASNKKPKNSDESREQIKEKNVKNKIKINPPQGVTEGFESLGGKVVEMYEISEASYEEIGRRMAAERAAKKAKEDKRMTVTPADKKGNTPAYQNYMKGDKRYKMVGEKLDMKKADMGEVIKDFRKSDAPQFKGKSDKKIQKMAIAAKLDAEDGVNEKFVPPYEPLKTVTDDQRKKREMAQKTKDHDDKMSGKLAEQPEARLVTLKKRLTSEELSIKDQMRISQEYNRKSPEEKKAAMKKALGDRPKVAPKKDTRTDAQKMADADASPRKGPGGATRAD